MKEIKEASKCISYLLKLKGKNISSRKIMELIKDKDLTDIDGLKTFVEDNADTLKVKSNKKKAIETFMVSHWSLLKENEDVKNALLNQYCMGRLTKEQRDKMVYDLISKCEETENKEYDF